MRTPLSLMTACSLLLAAPLASAQDEEEEQPDPVALNYECDGRYQSAVQVDGMQSDWEAEVQPVDRVMQLIAGEARIDWTGGNDASFKFWCRYDRDQLYFAINVRDNIIVGPEDGHDGDRLELWFDIGEDGDHERVMIEVPAWPVHDEMTTALSWGEGGSGTLEGAVAELSLRPERGYFVELNIPYSVFPQNPPGFAPVPFGIVQRDWDYDANREHEVGVGTIPGTGRRDELGTLTFTDATDGIRTLNERFGLGASVPPDAAGWGDFAGDNHQDMVAIIDGNLAMIGTGMDYAFLTLELGWRDDASPLRVEAHNIDDDVYDEVAVIYQRRRESARHEGVMLQTFMSVFDFDGSMVNRVIHQEIGNEIVGVGSVMADVDFEPGRIAFEAPRRPSLDEDAWFNIDAGLDHVYRDMPLPWREREVVYQLEGGDWIILDP